MRKFTLLLLLSTTGWSYTFNVPTEASLQNCPLDAKIEQATQKGNPQIKCVSSNGALMRTVTTEKSGITVKEAGSFQGPLQKAYADYYSTLSADARVGLPDPANRDLILMSYKKGRRDKKSQDQNTEIVLSLGRLDGDKPAQMGSALFDSSGKELMRENHFSKDGTPCQKFSFSTGLVSEHCSGSAGKEYKNKKGEVEQPLFKEDQCLDTTTNDSLRRRVVYNKADGKVEASAYKNNQLITKTEFKSADEAYKNLDDFSDIEDSDKNVSPQNVWKPLYRCNRISDHGGAVEMGESAQQAMTDYLGSQNTPQQKVEQDRTKPGTRETAQKPQTAPKTNGDKKGSGHK